MALYVLQFKITDDTGREDSYGPEIKGSREEVIADITKSCTKHGYTSSCCYNLDGSIDIKLEKPTEYFGISRLVGTATRYNPAKNNLL